MTRQTRISTLACLPWEVKPRRVSDDAVVLFGDWSGGRAAGLAEELAAPGPGLHRAWTALGSGLLAPRMWPTPRAQPPSRRKCWRITAPSGRVWHMRTDAFESLSFPGTYKVELADAPLVFV